MPDAHKHSKKPAAEYEYQTTENNDNFTYESKSAFQRASVKNYICPFNIDAHELNHIKILSKTLKFVRSFFVSTMPRFLTFGQFLRPLYDYGNTNTSVYIYPINEGIAQSNLNAIINQLEAQRIEAAHQENGNKEKVIIQKKLEAEALRDEVATGFNRLFEVSILSTLFANSQAELDSISDLMGLEISREMVSIKSAWSQQEEALKSNIPCCNNQIIRNNTFDTHGLATSFPFLSTDISHATGVPIGINKKSNLPILIDMFHPSFSNFNMILFGKVASGKRVAIQLLSLRSSVISGVQSIALDADGRYCKIAATLDGNNLSLAPASKIIFNPFEIETEMARDEITGKEKTILNLQNKIEDVASIIMTMARGPVKSKYVNEVTRKIIKDIVAEEYADAGITNNPDSLYSAYGANLIGTKITRNKRNLPTIGSWYKRLCQKAASNTNFDYKYHYEYLVKYMKDYVSELGGRISYYDGQSNYDLPLDSPFINFSLSKLDTKFEKPLAHQILLSWLWEKFFKNNNEDRYKAAKKRVFVDEAYLLLYYPEATEFLNIMGQRATQRNVSLAIISQKFDEFYKNGNVNELLYSASIKLFMQEEISEVDYLKEIFKLTNGERDFLVKCSKGEAILQIGTNSSQVYLAPTGHEIELIEANPSSFIIMGNEIEE